MVVQVPPHQPSPGPARQVPENRVWEKGFVIRLVDKLVDREQQNMLVAFKFGRRRTFFSLDKLFGSRCPLRPGHDPNSQILYDRFAENGMHRLCRSVTSSGAQGVGQVRHYLVGGHSAPATLAVRNKAGEATDQSIAIRWVEQIFHRVHDFVFLQQRCRQV